MKKVLFAFASAILALTSCSNESELLSPNENAGKEVMTTISVGMAPKTRATIDNDGAAANVNRCILEVRTGDSKKVYRHVEVSVDPTTLTATFQLPLVISQTYDFLFWADNATLDPSLQKFSDKFYNTQDLTAVKIMDATSGNLDEKDAFFTADHNVTFTGTVPVMEYILTRPFAQVNIITNDLKEIKAANDQSLASEELWPAKISVDYTTAFPTQFNVSTGVASEEKVISRKAEAVYGCAEAAAYNTLNMDYIFVNEEGGEDTTPFAITKAEITSKNGKVITILENEANIPMKRNYRTNIVGSFLTDPQDFKVEVSPLWLGDNLYNELPAPPAEPQGVVISDDGKKATYEGGGSSVVVVPEGVEEFDINPGSDGGKYQMDVESVTLPSTLKETDLTFCKGIADITYNCDADHDLIIHTTSFYGTGENNNPRGFTINFVGLPKSFSVQGASFDYSIGNTNFGRCWFNTGWDSNAKVVVKLPAGWQEAGLTLPYFTGGTVIYEGDQLVFSNVADTPMP